MMAEAPPPPLQMDAMPMLPFLVLNTLIRERMIRAPEQPTGWPSATAPPCTFTLLGSISRIFMFARGTAAKASLISWKSTFLIVMPFLYKSLEHALAGAIPKSMGATSASSYPIILARGFKPLSLAVSSAIRTIVQAPSLILEELAAVIVPFLANAGFRPGNLSGRNF